MTAAALPLGAAGAAPPFPPAVLRGFGEIASERFGLARMQRNPAGLARRLALALRTAQVPAAEAAEFLRTLQREADDSPEVLAAADALTNRETWFFRDHGQLQRTLETAATAAAARGGQRLRVLCAGCSTGEEPLSVAMLALAAPHLFWGGAIEVVGFDISPSALALARAGRFRATQLRRAEQGPPGWETRFFRRDGAHLLARSWLTEQVRFETHNLLGDRGRFEAAAFDLVLCRNVLIYFDERATAQALEALTGWVRPEGWLLLGSAEAGVAQGHPLERTPVAGLFQRRASR